LTRFDDAKDTPDAEVVAAAFRLLCDKLTNDYRKIGDTRHRLKILSWTLGGALAALLLLIAVWDRAEVGVFLVIAVLGGVGGALSAVRAVTATPARRIPEQLADYVALLSHPLVGAAAAIGAAVLLRAGIVTIKGDPDRVVYAAAFLAGFSERWFIGLVEGIGTKSG
jgi:hypothetical protein